MLDTAKILKPHALSPFKFKALRSPRRQAEYPAVAWREYPPPVPRAAHRHGGSAALLFVPALILAWLGLTMSLHTAP